ncbi:hypothetical protein E1091_00165 [Micromonospora fluostatini]|uniref:Uncharacterized protein n=1 Tax=Micromonospora fluostatini TaxID=1629071 RepID=A0ABY2DM64_9ACTN|nr:hypothetical protein E1091_00165 [Micromonospora fluostatini]
MSWSLVRPHGADMNLPGASLVDAVERNFDAIARELGVYQRGGYKLMSATLEKGDGTLGFKPYAQLTIEAMPSQELPLTGTTDVKRTFTGNIYAKPEEIPDGVHHFEIRTAPSPA